jgi:hypothetical protein
MKKSEPFYRVSYTYILASLGIEGKASHDFTYLDKAIEYMNYKKSVDSGKDFTITKVVTTYEVVANG